MSLTFGCWTRIWPWARPGTGSRAGARAGWSWVWPGRRIIMLPASWVPASWVPGCWISSCCWPPAGPSTWPMMTPCWPGGPAATQLPACCWAPSWLLLVTVARLVLVLAAARDTEDTVTAAELMGLGSSWGCLVALLGVMVCVGAGTSLVLGELATLPTLCTAPGCSCSWIMVGGAPCTSCPPTTAAWPGSSGPGLDRKMELLDTGGGGAGDTGAGPPRGEGGGRHAAGDGVGAYSRLAGEGGGAGDRCRCRWAGDTGGGAGEGAANWCGAGEGGTLARPGVEGAGESTL